jgi:transcriptional regulator ATRX
MEFYSMLNFIKPCFLGTTDEFSQAFAEPIKKGQYKDASWEEIGQMKQRCHILYSFCENFIARKNVDVLREFLPNKVEYAVYIGLSDLQFTLYEKYLEDNPWKQSKDRNLLTDWTNLRKIWTHVRVMEDSYANQIKTLKKKVEAQKNKQQYERDLYDYSDYEEFEDEKLEKLEEKFAWLKEHGDWWKDFCSESDYESLLVSNKFLVLFEIIKKCQEKGEKLVIFSEFVEVLEKIKYFLDKISDQDENPDAEDLGYTRFRARWVNGLDYQMLTGSTSLGNRYGMVKVFNDKKNKRMRLFLISARAGGIGINLVGANRCVIMDTSWNPASDQQNIFRIYRFGQEKTCYVYR